jgi:hypothetical protein
MNWGKIVRRFAAVVLASALAVLATGAIADEPLTWGDRFGLGLFLMTVGVGIVTMASCHRMQQL